MLRRGIHDTYAYACGGYGGEKVRRDDDDDDTSIEVLGLRLTHHRGCEGRRKKKKENREASIPRPSSPPTHESFMQYCSTPGRHLS